MGTFKINFISEHYHLAFKIAPIQQATSAAELYKLWRKTLFLSCTDRSKNVHPEYAVRQESELRRSIESISKHLINSLKAMKDPRRLWTSPSSQELFAFWLDN